MTLLHIEIHFEHYCLYKFNWKPIFFCQPEWFEREKRGLISYLSAWGSDRRLCLKNTAYPEKWDIYTKNGNEGKDVLGDSRKRYRGPWAEVGKYGTRKEQIRFQDSLPCPMGVINWYLYGDFVPSEVGNNVTNVSAVNCTFHRPVRKDKLERYWSFRCNFRCSSSSK